MTDGGRDRLTLAPSAADPQVGLLLAAMADSRRRTMRELESDTDAALALTPPPPEHRAHVALVRDLYRSSTP
jgi:hypothetical protein